MQTIKQLPNPFPQLGTPSKKIKIRPIGYDREVEEIKNFVISNMGKQPLIINILGEYGQGKTTFLKFLEAKFNGSRENSWANYLVKILDISEFPPIEDFLLEKQKEAKERGKKGIVIILDEVQMLLDEGNMDKQISRFLNSLRKFADGSIKGLENTLFTLILALSPETDKYFKEKGYYDVEQRRGTYKLVLKDIDYFVAHEMINEYFREMHKQDKHIKPSFGDYFDEAFINAFYILSQDVESSVYGIKRLNGRTLAQIFFILFEEYKKKGSKLDFEDLKEILLGKNQLKFKNYDLQINAEEYEEILKYVEGEPLKKTLEKLVFNPKWHFENEKEKWIMDWMIDDLFKKELISLRECIIVESDDVVEREKIEKQRIYLEGEKWIIFTDYLNEEQKKNLFKLIGPHEIKRVYRLSEEYLERIYGFTDEQTSFSRELKEYFDSRPSEKVSKALQRLGEHLKFKTTSFKEGSQYKFIEGDYQFLDKIKYKIALFYYADDYNNEDFKDYLENVVRGLENTEHDFTIIFTCPYYRNKTLENEEIEIRKMENRIFIENLSRDDLVDILESRNPAIIDEIIIESMKIYVREANKKGFTLALPGFKEKIKNKPSLFRERFIEELEKAWKIETGLKESVKSSILYSEAIDGDGKLQNLARKSLKEFIELDKNDMILGSKFSKYEERFLEMLDIERIEINKKEIENAMNKYLSSYSRFNILDYIPRILEKKHIINIQKDAYKLINQKDYLSEILALFKEGYLIKILSEEDIKTKEEIARLNVILKDLKANSSNHKWDKIAIYNTKLHSIKKILSSKIEVEHLDDLNKDWNELKENLEIKILSVPLSEITPSFAENKVKKVKKYFDENSNLNIDGINEFIKKELRENIKISPEVLEYLKEILDLFIEIDKSYEKDVNLIYKKIENIPEDLNNPNIEKMLSKSSHHNYSPEQIKS